jgi:hypothetical protein
MAPTAVVRAASFKTHVSVGAPAVVLVIALLFYQCGRVPFRVSQSSVVIDVGVPCARNPADL